MDAYGKLEGCFRQIRGKTVFRPKVALVLGSGLGGFAEKIEAEAIIDYSEIDGFPVSTVQGHKGRFVFGYARGVPVAVMQGRVHYYEGYDVKDVVLPIRLTGLMGAKAILITNAAGAVNFDYKPGDFMLITDHIANFVPSPLIGANMDSLGPRFPDMSEVYNKGLREAVREASAECGIRLNEGVYIQLAGPNYETPADVRMCRVLGADAVGMSTVCEAIAANHMGMKVAGISCISNMGCGMAERPLTHVEVQHTAGKAAPAFEKLVEGVICKISERC